MSKTIPRGSLWTGSWTLTIWLLFYLVFVAGWLIHPALLYHQLDGHYFEWTVISRAHWSSFWDFTVIDPFQGMVSLKMPENPWAHPGSWPLLWEGKRTVLHVVSYTIYFIELALATYLLGRSLGFSSLAAQLGAQLWLMMLFPPFNTFIGFNLWVSLIPIQVQTIAAGSLLLAGFAKLGTLRLSMNAALTVILLVGCVFMYYIAPLRTLAVAPGFAFLAAAACLLDRSRSMLTWRLATLAAGAGLLVLLNVVNYYGALLAHSPRLWEGTESVIGDITGRIERLEAFFCRMGLYCAARPGRFIAFYGSVLLSALALTLPAVRRRTSWNARVVLVAAAVFLIVLIAAYSAPFFVQSALFNKVPSPLYVYNPLFPVFCVAIAHIWIALASSATERLREFAYPRRTPASPSAEASPRPARGEILMIALSIVPAFTFYLCWEIFGLRWAIHSLQVGAPVVRSLHAVPAATPVVKYLQERIALKPGGRFNGSVASYLGTEAGPIGAIFSASPLDRYAPRYIDVMDYLTREHGNSYMLQDLWGFSLPTIEEYGHFINPANLRVAADLLSGPPHFQLPTILFTYQVNASILGASGVRYVISDIALDDRRLRYVMTQPARERSLSLAELKQKLEKLAKVVPGGPPAPRAASNVEAVAAAERGDLERIRQLHQSGADLRIDNDAPLLAAARNGHVNVIRYFHEHGVLDPAIKATELVDTAHASAKYAVIDYLINSAGVLLSSLPIARFQGFPVYLYEIEAPNLATYSPTLVTRLGYATEAIQRMRMEDFAPEREVITQDPLSGPYVAVRSGEMLFERNSIRVRATSAGRSLLLLPVQFSRCWTVERLEDQSRERPRLVRANLAQTVMEFEGTVDIRMRFAMGFSDDGACRKRDAQELREMRILESKNSRAAAPAK